MKILLINKFLYPKGGDAISTLETGRLLSEKGHEVVFWGMAHPKNQDFLYKEYFVSYIDYNKPLGRFQQLKNSFKILYSLEAKSKISNLLKEWKPDIAHLNNFAHQISPSVLDVFKKYKIPTVMTIHDYKLVCPTYSMLLHEKPCEQCKNGKYYYCFINKCTKNSKVKSFVNTLEMYLHHKVLKIYNKIDIFISPSKFLMNKIKEMGFDSNIIYLPNFVDLDKYEPFYETEDNSIVYLGRLSREKGLYTLISAVKNLDVRLKIVGSGPCENELKNKVKVENMSNVYFLGYKEEKELIDIIRESLFLVIPSECYENNPRAVLEAFALGKPVIGARIGGIPELVIDEQTGLTFESGNAQDLKDKIIYLLGNPDMIRKMGYNARKFVFRKFCPDKYYDKLMKIYKKAIKNHEK